MQASKLSGRYKVTQGARCRDARSGRAHCCGRANAAGDEAPATERALNAGGPLVLLCHKFWCPFRAAQHGQRESVVARAATNLRRIVAIEFGTWRSGRNGGSSGLVTFA